MDHMDYSIKSYFQDFNFITRSTCLYSTLMLCGLPMVWSVESLQLCSEMCIILIVKEQSDAGFGLYGCIKWPCLICRLLEAYQEATVIYCATSKLISSVSFGWLTFYDYAYLSWKGKVTYVYGAYSEDKGL